MRTQACGDDPSIVGDAMAGSTPKAMRAMARCMSVGLRGYRALKVVF